MNKILDTLNDKVTQPLSKLSEQRHLRAVRDGVISAIPLIIIGSFFLIIAFPPIPTNWAFHQWATAHALQILIPYRLTFWIMSLYICFGIGYNLAKSYELDPLAGGQLSVAAFLLSIMPVTTKAGLMLPMESLGSVGIFPCMILAIFAVEVLRVCKKHNLTFKMPEQVPSSVAHSFEAIVPAGIIILVMTLINVVLKINLETVIQTLFSPLVKAGDTLPGVLVPAFLTVFLWIFGISGDSIVGSIARPIWLQYFTENAESMSKGQQPTHIAPETFFQWFVSIGGSGATIGLIICALLVGKAKYTKSITRASMIPALFNINEPIIFGFPVMLNPIFFIPFIGAPLVMVTVSWFAFKLGFVHLMFVQPPWTLPAPIGAFLATGGDWRAIVLCLVDIVIATVIYYPFVRMYDRQELAKEQEGLSEEDAG
ncbi:MAG: PTS sugar transporter subunit IIC [Schleiferilactobacillus perolens]|jgi:PTS system cellobiose-specific IIC component|uniref:Permease IIC component n=1 Tax=Schleiferilactobacillus perolens DSM 12744 TaxID=1423792 RepID=A0A0R1N2P3_9LACO|nr:PTS sugar transporter subunit IIC [Schleiferilactobacillus perolens]KRL14478.1 PTS system lactose cellobiose family transporter subunit IIC [Schleiferilactobacillus perolens DSM 12744]MCI1911441.1 PTS sugar transporter subunit IIC [Schleiferilactobacillus harbinensis]